MRIHVTYAGGTIGMVDSPDGLRPGADMASWLNTQFDGIELTGQVSMSQLSPLVDSSETTPIHWQMIIDDIRAHADEADAFLVLHGTDTMAYSAAALSYALADFTKPIVLTGSQYPLGVVGTDASANVTGALRAAGSSQVSGVTLFFGHMLLAGNRSTKTSSWAFAGFDSPSTLPIARTGAPWRWYHSVEAGEGWANPAPYARPERHAFTFHVYSPARGGYDPRIRRGEYSRFRPGFCGCFTGTARGRGSLDRCLAVPPGRGCLGPLRGRKHSGALGRD